MQILKADTQVKVRIGPFVDVGDGFTPETGVTLAGGGDNADEAELLKHNGAATADISANTWAAIANCDGWYDLTLTAGNLDTEGLLDVVIQNDSVHLPVHARFMVANATAYDSFYAAAGTDYLSTNVSVNTTVNARTSDSVFTINAGSATNSCYVNMVCAVYDVSGAVWECRKISAYVGATKQVTVDTAFTFTIQAGTDLVRIFYDTYCLSGTGATAAQVWQYNVDTITTQGYAGTYQHSTGGRYG